MRSQTWTPLPPPSPQHLSGSSPCTCPKQAAPYVRHGHADIQSCHLLLDDVQFNLTDGLNMPGSYAILFLTALDFTFITSHIHNWALFSLWLRIFILSGAISLLFSSSILGNYQSGGFIFQCLFFFFCLLISFTGLSRQEYRWFAIPFSNGPCFVWMLHHDLSVLGGPTGHGS